MAGSSPLRISCARRAVCGLLKRCIRALCAAPGTGTVCLARLHLGQVLGQPDLLPQGVVLRRDPRDVATSDLRQIKSNLDDGLTPADPVSANMMRHGGQWHLIDFEDGGYGFRTFEMVPALLKFLDGEDFPALRASLIVGYGLIVRSTGPPLICSWRSVRRLMSYGSRREWARRRQTCARRITSTTRRLAQTYLGGDAHGAEQGDWPTARAKWQVL